MYCRWHLDVLSQMEQRPGWSVIHCFYYFSFFFFQMWREVAAPGEGEQTNYTRLESEAANHCATQHLIMSNVVTWSLHPFTFRAWILTCSLKCEVTVNLTFEHQAVISPSLNPGECLRQVKWNSFNNTFKRAKACFPRSQWPWTSTFAHQTLISSYLRPSEHLEQIE